MVHVTKLASVWLSLVLDGMLLVHIFLQIVLNVLVDVYE